MCGSLWLRYFSFCLLFSYYCLFPSILSNRYTQRTNLSCLADIVYSFLLPPSLPPSLLFRVTYDAEGETETPAYDSDSSSTIRLSNGMVLYLREVDE